MAHLAEYGKNYHDIEEFVMRAKIFTENDEYISSFNLSAGEDNMRLGHQRFSDWSKEEMSRLSNK